MSGDRTKHTFDGAGTTLAKTYGSSVTGSTSLYACEPYDHLIVVVDATVSSGSIKVFCDGSLDGTNIAKSYELNNGSPGEASFTINTTGKYKLTFPNLGDYFSVRIENVSGSTVVNSVIIQAKS